MAEQEGYPEGPGIGGDRERDGMRIPLEGAAQALDQRYRLYLSDQQQKGLAAGLALGVVLGSAVLAWALANQAREHFG